MSRIKRLPEGHYVYCYWDTSGDVPLPIYIGKGKKFRVIRHLVPHVLADGSERSARFKDLLACGRLMFSFLSTGLREIEAFAHEQNFISLVGRLNSGDGPLLNRTDGGRGSFGAHMPKGVQNKMSRAVVCGGLEFSSMREASEHEQVTIGALISRIRNGWPGYYYVDEGQRPNRKGRRRGSDSPRSRAVFAGGVRYDTLSTAAISCEIGLTTLFKRIASGWPGYYYEEEGQRPRTKLQKGSIQHVSAMREKRNNKLKAVVVGDTRFRSMSSAAKQLGVTYATIRARCRSSTFPDYKFDQYG